MVSHIACVRWRGPAFHAISRPTDIAEGRKIPICRLSATRGRDVRAVDAHVAALETGHSAIDVLLGHAGNPALLAV